MRARPKVKISKGLRDPRFMAVFVGLFGLLGCIVLFSSHAATPTAAVELENGTVTSPAGKVTDSNASGGSAVKFGSVTNPSGCTVSAILVNSCRPWLGATASDYSAVASDWKSQLLYHEQRIGHQVDVAHSYNGVGANTVSSAAQYFVNRPNTYLMQNWKPAANWADAAGGNASVNATIDQMAASVKALAPHKIFLTIYHEPEDNTSSGGTCSTYKGTAGTTTDYVNMWHNVRSRFDAAGVNNVVWVMNYMGFSNWNCLVKALWPGNSYVDWVTWDPYASGSTSWTSMVNTFYNWLGSNSDASHDFNSKPWGFNEFGSYNMTSAQQYAFYDAAKTAIQNNTYPKVKLYDMFDLTGSLGDHRVGYSAGAVDQTAQNHYNGFVNALLAQGQ